MNLYQIANEFKTISDIIEQNDEINEDVLQVYQQSEMALEEKIINTVYVMRNIEADVEAIDAEIKRLQQRKTVIKNKVETLKNAIKDAMAYTETDKVKNALITVTLSQPTAGSVVVDMEKLPEEYKTTKTVIEANKALIKEELKLGVIIEGAELEMIRKLSIR